MSADDDRTGEDRASGRTDDEAPDDPVAAAPADDVAAAEGVAAGHDVAVDERVLEGLGGALLWRVGRVTDEGPVTVRVGFATAAPLFAELPRLRTATDAELEQALHDRSVTVEWVGPRPR